jgi:signal peptidase I
MSSGDGNDSPTDPPPTGGGQDGEPPAPAVLATDAARSGTRTIVEWLFVAVGALVVAFLIRQFLVQAFYIPSESMEPTLMVGDRLLVNKLSYKTHDVHRGDILVFETPPNVDITEKDLIKRVVALPGETVELRDGTIYIDDRQLTEPYTAPGSTTTSLGWVQGCANPQSEVNRCTVPAGHIFVMGDNRNHSRDSRVFGPISEDLIVGRAFLRVWPLGDFGVL